MKIIDRLKNGYHNKSYFISAYDNSVYLINYKEILNISDTTIMVRFNNFKLIIKGKDFRIIRKSNIDLEIKGIVSNMEMIHE